MSKTKEVVVRLDNVVISYPELWNPSAMEATQKPAYSAHAILERTHPAVEKLKAAMKEVAISAWGENGAQLLASLAQQGRVCLRDGNTKVKNDGSVAPEYAGKLFVATRSYVKPTVIGRGREPLTEADGVIYGGAVVNMLVAIWAQTGTGKTASYGKRINAQLRGVQFVKDGEAFGGGRPASPDAFDQLEDEFGESADAPTADDFI